MESETRQPAALHVFDVQTLDMSGALAPILCNREYATPRSMVPPKNPNLQTIHTSALPSDLPVSLFARGCNKPRVPRGRALKSLPEKSADPARSLHRAGFSRYSIAPAFQPAQLRYLRR